MFVAHGVFMRYMKTPFYFSISRKEECRLAITREKKEELIAQYKERINKSSAIVFTDYLGMHVAQSQSLRAKLQETGTTYMVVKNTLFGIALEQSGKVRPDSLLVGPNAVAFIGEDIGKGVVALMDWIKAEKIAAIRGALLESSVLDAAGAEGLADLPTKEQVRAKVLGALNAPAGSLARLLSAPGASLVRVLNARVEKQQEAQAA
jgi:large subunit ribosomal protein L10